MIGDVIKAKKKSKKLVGAEIVKKLSARVQKAEAQNWTANNIVNNVSMVTGEHVFRLLLKGANDLVEIMRLLSTKPHTTSSSNYMKYVSNNVKQDQFVEYLEKAYNNEILNEEEIKYLDKVKGELEKYLKREGEDFKNRKHKDVSEKMQSLREVNRFKVTMTALTINVIDYAEESNELRKKEKEAERKKREEAEKKAREEAEKKAREEAEKKERWAQGKLTLEEFQKLTGEQKRKLKHLIIPQGITTIAPNTFSDFRELESVTIPNTVTSIEEEAFKDCYALKSVTIPNSVKTIGKKAFDNCRGLKSVTIPNSITSIAEQTFFECIRLTNVTIPNSVKTIGGYAFGSCWELENVIIQEGGLTEIEEVAFWECKKLSSVTIPGTVKSLSARVFLNCEMLNKVIIEEGVHDIGSAAFSGCTNLGEITIPGSVAIIDNYAFSDCSNLSTVTIKKGERKTICGGAFENCKSLKKLVIPPNNIDEVRQLAFWGCPTDMEIEGAGEEDTYIVRAIKKQCAGDRNASGEPHKPGAMPPPDYEEKVTTNYYDDFVKKFNQMCENEDYKKESIEGLFKIYSDNKSAFTKECKAKPQDERNKLGKELLKYFNKARSVNDYNFLVDTIQMLRNTIVNPYSEDPYSVSRN